jgi:cell division transport system permease protein
MVTRIDFKRVIQSGILSFQRNSWLSTASIVMMTFVLFMVGGLIFMQVMTTNVLATFSEKIDVSVYVKANTPENQIFKVRDELKTLPEVKEVVYVSQEDALARFKDTHKGNALILDSLAELERNPLQASLNIKANEAGQFERISEYLSSKNYPFIDKINFFENKAMIERLAGITFSIRSGGLLLAVILAIIAMIIAFNTIRIAIYSNREEIQIMKLVGASHWYIRGPFIVEGVLHGVLSSLITMMILFPIAWIISPRIGSLIPGFDMFLYFQEHVFTLFLTLLAVGICLGVASSMIAIRRYLKEV